MNSGTQLNGQSLEATTQAPEKEQISGGSEELAATSCTNVFTMVTQGWQKEGLFWSLDTGTGHI